MAPEEAACNLITHVALWVMEATGFKEALYLFLFSFWTVLKQMIEIDTAEQEISSFYSASSSKTQRPHYP